MHRPISSRNTMVWRVVFVIVLAIGGFLRLTNLDLDEVRTDEGNYAVRAVGWNDFMFSTTLGTPWVWYQNEEILPWWTQLSFSDHPPLHFATIWLSSKVFGVHLWAVRLPSALYGIGAIAVLMLLISKLASRSGAIIAGVTLALLPWHIFISRQAIQESGVIFWISATILVAILANTYTAQGQRRAMWWWMLLGIVFGLGILTKYSAVVVALPLLWFAVKQRWYQRPGYWLAPAAAAVLLAPVMYYNWQVFLLRGHLDLQLSRFFRQDTRRDWPASNQAIWQGDPRQIFVFLKNQALGVSVIPSVLVFLGTFGLWKNRKRLQTGTLAFSFGAAAVGGALALATLNDYGRSSILLPFYTVMIGVSCGFVPRYARYALATVGIGVLALTALPISARMPKISGLVATFPVKTVGFNYWETWRAKQIPMSLAPIHYASLIDWLHHQMALAEAYPDKVYIIDNRFAWFPLNWYFNRYTFYARESVFFGSGVFAFLNDQNLLESLRGRRIRYVEAGPASLDSKAAFDIQTQRTENFFRGLIASQDVVPVIVDGTDGQILLQIWEVNWDSDVKFPRF